MAVLPTTIVWREPARSKAAAVRVKIMAQILKFEETFGFRDVRSEKQSAAHTRIDEDDTYSFWPEVSCGLWSKSSVPVDPRNSPQRVLSEMMLIVGGAGLLVMLAAIFLGTPSP